MFPAGIEVRRERVVLISLKEQGLVGGHDVDICVLLFYLVPIIRNMDVEAEQAAPVGYDNDERLDPVSSSHDSVSIAGRLDLIQRKQT